MYALQPSLEWTAGRKRYGDAEDTAKIPLTKTTTEKLERQQEEGT
jgi:hypothetical protein